MCYLDDLGDLDRELSFYDIAEGVAPKGFKQSFLHTAVKSLSRPDIARSILLSHRLPCFVQSIFPVYMGGPMAYARWFGYRTSYSWSRRRCVIVRSICQRSWSDNTIICEVEQICGPLQRISALFLSSNEGEESILIEPGRQCPI